MVLGLLSRNVLSVLLFVSLCLDAFYFASNDHPLTQILICWGPFKGTNRQHLNSWNKTGQLAKPCLGEPWRGKALVS